MVLSEHGQHPLGHDRITTRKRSDGLQSGYAEMQWLFGVRTDSWAANRPIIMVRGHEVVGRPDVWHAISEAGRWGNHSERRLRSYRQYSTQIYGAYLGNAVRYEISDPAMRVRVT